MQETFSSLEKSENPKIIQKQKNDDKNENILRKNKSVHSFQTVLLLISVDDIFLFNFWKVPLKFRIVSETPSEH